MDSVTLWQVVTSESAAGDLSRSLTDWSFRPWELIRSAPSFLLGFKDDSRIDFVPLMVAVICEAG